MNARAGPVTPAGLPIEAGTRIWFTNPRPNMNGWSWNAPSASQRTPSVICRPRRSPVDPKSAAQARRPGELSRSAVASCAEAGRNRVAKASADPAAVTHRPGPAWRRHHRVAAQRPQAGRELEEQEAGEPGGQEAGQADHPAGPAAAPQGVGDSGQRDDGPGGGQHPAVAAAYPGDADQPGERRDPGQERTGDHDGSGGHAAEADGSAPAAQRADPGGHGPARRPDSVHRLVNHAWHLSCKQAGGSEGGTGGGGAGRAQGQARPAPAAVLPEHGEVQEQVAGDVPGHLERVGPLQALQLARALVRG